MYGSAGINMYKEMNKTFCLDSNGDTRSVIRGANIMVIEPLKMSVIVLAILVLSIIMILIYLVEYGKSYSPKSCLLISFNSFWLTDSLAIFSISFGSSSLAILFLERLAHSTHS